MILANKQIQIDLDRGKTKGNLINLVIKKWVY